MKQRGSQPGDRPEIEIAQPCPGFGVIFIEMDGRRQTWI